MKQKNVRKLPFLMALLMCLTLFPVASFAASSDFVIENGVLTKYKGSGGHVEIPDGVTTIGGNAFSAHSGDGNNLGYLGSITSVTIPDSVTEIGGGAFSGTDIKSIVIPDSVTSLGGNSGNVFSRCANLERVILGSGITEIQGYTFNACTNLKSITIPDNVTLIGARAFSGCRSLESVTIGSGVKSIGERAFLDCRSLTSLEIGGDDMSIAPHAFSQCESLKSVTIPASVTHIDHNAFYECTALKEVTFGGSDTYIGNWAFYKSEKLETVYGLAGSTAATFAKNNKLTFIAQEPEIFDAPNLDAASDWAREQINKANYLGLIPDSLQASYTQNITRAEFCALGVSLYETVMGRELTKLKTFDDTSDINVAKMAGMGAVSGVGDGIFDPDAGLTREQAASILSRLATLMGKTPADEDGSFADMDLVSEWAVRPVGRMQSSGIMGGVGDNKFDPQGAYTREQSIATMLRLYDFMKSN